MPQPRCENRSVAIMDGARLQRHRIYGCRALPLHPGPPHASLRFAQARTTGEPGSASCQNKPFIIFLSRYAVAADSVADKI